MGKLRDTMSLQDLALHDSGELLPQSAQLLAEDRETERLALFTANQTATVLTDEMPR